MRRLFETTNKFSGYEIMYHRVLFLLMAAGYLVSHFVTAGNRSVVHEFIVSRDLLSSLPLLFFALSFVPYLRARMQDMTAVFFLFVTLHFIGFSYSNGMTVAYEWGLAALVLFANLHFHKLFHLVLYNVITLTILEFLLMLAPVPSAVNPVLFFLLMLMVMLTCIFFQLYRLRFIQATLHREKFLEQLYSQSPDAWIMFDRQTFLGVECNAKALEMLDIGEKNDLAVLNLKTMLGSLAAGKDDKTFIKEIENGALANIQADCTGFHQKKFPASVSLKILPGFEQFVSAHITDLSLPYKKSEKERSHLQHFKNLVSELPYAVLLTDADGKVKHINKSARQLFGIAEAEEKIKLPGMPVEYFQIAASGQHSLKTVQEKEITLNNASKLVRFTGKIIFNKAEGVQENLWIAEDISSGQKEHEELESISKKFQSFFDEAPFGLAVMTEDGKFSRSNQRFADVLGYNASELELLSLTDLIHPSELTGQSNAGLSDFRNGNIPVIRQEKCFLKKNGTQAWTFFSASKLRDQNGKPAEVLVMIEDITSRKNIEQSLSESTGNLAAVLENSSDAILSVDNNHTIVLMNNVFRDRFEERHHHRLSKGDNYRDALPPDEHEEWNALHRRVMKGEHIQLEEKVSHRNGSNEFYEVSLRPVLNRNGLPEGVSYFSKEITQRIAFEKELMDARSAAESAASAKAQFLATMSHEIRTPLNGLIGMTELLKTTGLKGKQSEYADAIQLSGEALLQIINDVLDLSKIESQKIELEKQPFEIRECIEETFGILYSRSLEKGLELLYTAAPDVPVKLVGDKSRLRQVLINLVGNAIKFTSQGKITVGVKKISTEGQHATLQFSVEDTGIGIAPENVERIFKAFSQGDVSTARKYGGTGLGLSISAKLVQLMNGKIWVESTPGKGSTFYFSMTAEAMPDEPVRFIKPAAGSLANLRVCFVTANENQAEIISGYLSEWNMRVIRMKSKEELTDFFKAHRYADMVLIDFDLVSPDADAFIHHLDKILKGDKPKLAVFNSVSTDRTWDNENKVSLWINKDSFPARWQKDISSLFYEQAEKDTLVTPASTTARETPLQILVAEDNLISQRLILAILETLGHHAGIASDGAEALKMAGEKKYDLIFMDIQMPVMDGFEATKKIKELKGKQVPKIVAMTAYAMEGDREKCLEAGMDDYLSKPILMENVQRMLDKWGSMKRTPDQSVPAAAQAAADEIIDNDAVKRLKDINEKVDPMFLDHILGMFFEQAPQITGEIIRAHQSNDATAMAQAAHKLKGTCLNLGAKKLGEFCKAIEAKGKNMEMKSAAGYIEELKPVLDETISAFRKIVNG